MDNVDSGVKPVIQLLTASQSVAGQYMDGDNQVLSYDIPLPITELGWVRLLAVMAIRSET